MGLSYCPRQQKNGSICLCIDYRKMNRITRKDAYPLPQKDDTLDTLSGSQWFTNFDLVSGYWQVEVDERDRQKTAFAHQMVFSSLRSRHFACAMRQPPFSALWTSS